jgi:hypothetical protein
VADVMTLFRGAREIRITREKDDTPAVELPKEGKRITSPRSSARATHPIR